MKNVKLLDVRPAKPGRKVRVMSQPGGLPSVAVRSGRTVEMINLLGYVTR